MLVTCLPSVVSVLLVSQLLLVTFMLAGSPRLSTTSLSSPSALIVEQISGKIWHNRGFNDKSVKTSKIVHLDLLNKIGYGPIA